jgi:hypothetical protein
MSSDRLGPTSLSTSERLLIAGRELWCRSACLNLLTYLLQMFRQSFDLLLLFCGSDFERFLLLQDRRFLSRSRSLQFLQLAMRFEELIE